MSQLPGLRGSLRLARLVGSLAPHAASGTPRQPLRIAVLDDYTDCVRHLEAFRRLQGHDVRVFTDSASDADQLVTRLADREAVVLIRERSSLPSAVLERLPALRVISQTGRAGKHVDLDACKRRGITVLSGKGSPHAAAELTWALVLAARRGIVGEAGALRAGKWQLGLGTTVRGRTLGVLGYGNIGALVAGFGRAFGMNVQVFGRQGSAERAKADGVALAQSLEHLFSTSDVLCLHVKLSPETAGLVTTAHLALMKPSSLLVNTSRAELVAPGALLAALDAGRPGMAALDVFDREPAVGPGADPLVTHPRVLATPHLGYVERDSYEMYLGDAFQNLLDWEAKR